MFLDERGPFSTGSQPETVALTPPVPLQQGDLIGIARVADCGNPTAVTGIVTAGYAAYAGDVTSNVSLSAGTQGNGVLAVYATGNASESVARTNGRKSLFLPPPTHSLSGNETDRRAQSTATEEISWAA